MNDYMNQTEKKIMMVMAIAEIIIYLIEIIMGGVNYENCPTDHRVSAFVVIQGVCMVVNAIGMVVCTALGCEKRTMITLNLIFFILHLGCIIYGAISIDNCPCKGTQIYQCAMGFIIVTAIIMSVEIVRHICMFRTDDSMDSQC